MLYRLTDSLLPRAYRISRYLPVTFLFAILLCLGAQAISAQTSPSTSPDSAKMLADIEATCQRKGHCAPFNVASKPCKDVTVAMCLKDFSKAGTDMKRYQLINAYLAEANLLLKCHDEAQQSTGVIIAWQAAIAASMKLHDNIMASNISTLMIKPHLSLLPYSEADYCSFETVAKSLATIYSTVHDDANVVDIYRLIIDSDCANDVKDATRLLYAQGLAQHGNFTRTLEVLREISTDGITGEAMNEIAIYSKMLAEQQKIKSAKEAKP